MCQRGVPGDIDLPLVQGIDQGIVVRVKHVIHGYAVALEVALDSLEDSYRIG